jgi:hypothetical protein
MSSDANLEEYFRNKLAVEDRFREQLIDGILEAAYTYVFASDSAGRDAALADLRLLILDAEEKGVTV